MNGIKKRIALIDADGLLYHASKDTIEESIEIIDEKINNILHQTECDFFSLFLSPSQTFRNKVYPLYKANRKKYGQPLKFIKTLKAYLIEQYNAQEGNYVEADDLIAYWYNYSNINHENVFIENKIICSPDKDLLKCIPGEHFNYTYKLEDKNNPETLIKGWWVTTSEEEAAFNFWVSMITGDVADNISGLKGKGIKYGVQLLEDFFKEHEILGNAVYDEYIDYYFPNISTGIYEFSKTFRTLHLLQNNDDFINEVGESKLPEYLFINKTMEQEEIF